MSPLLVALLMVLLVPLFVGKWRTSLLGLAAQGLLMAWLAVGSHGDGVSVAVVLRVLDLALVRGVVAPLLLFREMRSQDAPPRIDVIPPNMLSWALALGGVLVAFHFAELMVPRSVDEQSVVAVAAIGTLLGFLVLATQPNPFSQIVGALRLENSIALFELGSATHHTPLGVQIAQLIVFVLTIWVFRWYLRRLGATGRNAAATAEESSP